MVSRITLTQWGVACVAHRAIALAARATPGWPGVATGCSGVPT